MIALLTALLLLAGGLFCCLAALGLLRLPDVLTRMHASTKAGTLGAGLILSGVAVHAVDSDLALRALVAVAFLLLTAPVAAHMIGRAAYRTGAPLCKETVVDELAGAAPREGRAEVPGPAAPAGAGAPPPRAGDPASGGAGDRDRES